jgi:hypothetical protein
MTGSREKEWVRRLGASPPMRMNASWFGSWTHRIQGRGAIDPRPESGLPSDRHPDRTKVKQRREMHRSETA